MKLANYEVDPGLPFVNPEITTINELAVYVKKLKEFPLILRHFTGNLTEKQLDTKTEKGVWTVRQVIHHIADSHMNAFIRYKLTLTENIPVVKPYREDLWAELRDSKFTSVDSSLKIIEGVHLRWYECLSILPQNYIRKSYFHPEMEAEVPISTMIPLYVWHGNYHLGFIIRATA